MASKIISALTELTSVDTTNDKVVILDASAPTEAKFITPDNLVPDATTTMKGKSELATTAEVTTGTDTVRTVTPSGYNGSFSATTSSKIVAATNKTAPVGADLFPILDSAASNVLKNITWTQILAALGGGLAISDVYPVGSIYTNKTVSTNPATLFGFGTWVAVAGRVVVGIDAGQTEFDTAGETGGSKTHTLTSGEMPSHTHTQDPHAHNIRTLGGGGSGNRCIDAGATEETAINSWDTIIPATTATNQNTGGGGAHNNLQPYVVCYVWERTA